MNDLRNRPCSCSPVERQLDLDGRCARCGGRIYSEPDLDQEEAS